MKIPARSSRSATVAVLVAAAFAIPIAPAGAATWCEGQSGFIDRRMQDVAGYALAGDWNSVLLYSYHAYRVASQGPGC